VWHTINPFTSHGGGNRKSWWKIYNNTIVTKRSGNLTAVVLGGIGGNPEKYVYNNIFYVLDDRSILRGDRYDSRAKYNGNVYYRQVEGKRPLFVEFGSNHNYATLALFRLLTGSDWELNSLDSDPGFDQTALADPTFDPATMDLATIRERYRPSNCLIYTPGASYEGLDWPGTAGVTYRGAVPPNDAAASGNCIVQAARASANSTSSAHKVFLPFVAHD
jgi:hypothetical protein